jgi:hypothetical protein
MGCSIFYSFFHIYNIYDRHLDTNYSSKYIYIRDINKALAMEWNEEKVACRAQIIMIKFHHIDIKKQTFSFKNFCVSSFDADCLRWILQYEKMKDVCIKYIRSSDSFGKLSIYKRYHCIYFGDGKIKTCFISFHFVCLRRRECYESELFELSTCRVKTVM